MSEIDAGEGSVTIDGVPQKQPEPYEPSPAPEIFVDGYCSSTCIGGMIKLAFFSTQYDIASKRVDQRVVLRLTMPVGSAVGIHQALGSFLQQVEAGMAGMARAH